MLDLPRVAAYRDELGSPAFAGVYVIAIGVGSGHFDTAK